MSVPRLIDTKGLGKPFTFKGEPGKFNEWLRKTVSYVVSCYGSSFKSLLEWVEDQETAIGLDDL
eukprot:984160-Amphidinium_carterae.2